jgi:glutathione peroxidase
MALVYNQGKTMSDLLFNTPVKTLKGESGTLEPFKGKVILVVNTASKCGFTPQYAGLEKLHQEFASKGLVVLGFPCNQFGNQEDGNHTEIEEFCQINYGVSFPIFEKVEVNGSATHPIFSWLKSQAPGLLGSKSIKWNFTKFLVSPDGKEVLRFASKVSPKEMVPKVEEFLAKQ